MRYWIYHNGEVPGNYEPGELAEIPDFGAASMVCPVEGGIAERNWQQAAQFPDIVSALRRRETARRPLPPESPMPELQSSDPGVTVRGPNEVLNDSSAKIFRHVTDIMKELENRRAERALNQSLQRQVIELKNELLALKERNQFLQSRADLIPAFEDREKSLQETLGSLRSDLQEREQRIRGLEVQAKVLQEELAKVRSESAQSAEDARRQSTLAAGLSKELAEKEFTLAKAFGVIRRLEEVLGEILPESVSGISREVPGYTSLPPRPVPAPEIRVRSVELEPAAAVSEDRAPWDVAEPRPAMDVLADAPGEPPARCTAAYTVDTGLPDAPTPLPPEGTVAPLPPPWQAAFDRLSRIFRRK